MGRTTTVTRRPPQIMRSVTHIVTMSGASSLFQVIIGPMPSQPLMAGSADVLADSRQLVDRPPISGSRVTSQQIFSFDFAHCFTPGSMLSRRRTRSRCPASSDGRKPGFLVSAPRREIAQQGRGICDGVREHVRPRRLGDQRGGTPERGAGAGKAQQRPPQVRILRAMV